MIKVGQQADCVRDGRDRDKGVSVEFRKRLGQCVSVWEWTPQIFPQPIL